VGRPRPNLREPGHERRPPWLARYSIPGLRAWRKQPTDGASSRDSAPWCSAAAEPTPVPCGAEICTYQQFSDDDDEDEWADDDDDEWDDEGDWESEDPGFFPYVELCGGVDTPMPFIELYDCMPVAG